MPAGKKKREKKTEYVGVALPADLARRIDDLEDKGIGGYASRMEFVKDAVRRRLEDLEKKPWKGRCYKTLPLSDFLLPRENVKFQSEATVKFANKNYQVVVTDSRLILYARRGMVLKRDDVVTERLSDIQVKYSEKGMIRKEGTIEIQGKNKYLLTGNTSEMKALYQSIIQFL